MDELQNLRAQIDGIDESIVRLLSSRFETVQKIAEYKKKNGLAVYMPDRETEVVRKISEMTEKPEQKEYILRIYAEILKASRAAQNV